MGGEFACTLGKRIREAERDRVSTIYDLAGRLNLERGFAEAALDVLPDAKKRMYNYQRRSKVLVKTLT